MSEPTTKNLTILLTDIKGFTDKTSHRSRAEIQALLDEHNRLVLPVLQKRGGRLIKTMGDAFLMTFESPTNAVLAGIEVQQVLRVFNVGKTPDDRIEVRVSINQGEVNLSDNDVFGEPVNITARIQAFADGGEVFFTEAIYLSMNKTEVPSSEVGLLQLKGIPEKVKVYRVRRSGDAPAVEPPPPIEAAVRAAVPVAVPAPAAPPAASDRAPLIVACLLVLGAALLVARLVTRHGGGLATPSARFADRTFPSVFGPWNIGIVGPGADPLAQAAKHDLLFASPPSFKLRWNDEHSALASGFTPESVVSARAYRHALLERNPRMILLADLHYTDAGDDTLPPDHPWWKRDAAGARIAGWKDHHVLDLSIEAFRQRVVEQCRLVLATDVFDGCIFSPWEDDADHLALAAALRAVVGERVLLIAGSGTRKVPQSAPFFNGLYVHDSRLAEPKDWGWLEQSIDENLPVLREPKLLLLEAASQGAQANSAEMRQATTFALTLTDGYVAYTQPDASHRWFAFWDKSLGKPLGPGRRRDDGATLREFERGAAVYNPLGGQTVKVEFQEPRVSAATGTRAAKFELASGDGDLYLKP